MQSELRAVFEPEEQLARTFRAAAPLTPAHGIAQAVAACHHRHISAVLQLKRRFNFAALLLIKNTSKAVRNIYRIGGAWLVHALFLWSLINNTLNLRKL